VAHVGNKKMNPFDYVNDINYNKKNIIKNSDNPELAEKLYTPYLVNKALSQFSDTVRIVNEMNIHHQLDKKLQFDFLINIIRSKKRFSKWAKKQDDENLELVMQHYGYSYDKAKQVLPLLSNDQIITIKKKRFEGGLNGN
jgi:predicted transcriptional regulator